MTKQEFFLKHFPSVRKRFDVIDICPGIITGENCRKSVFVQCRECKQRFWKGELKGEKKK